ncbi:unnamed protein product [Rotaria sp. Silwood1]|nr:unnamed protein product [Rotaria sp. Silwood1]
MSRTKLVTTQQLMNTTLFNKSDITPLMAKPYEVVNATNDNNDGSQDVTKPPDKPNVVIENSSLLRNYNFVVVVF